MQAFMWDEAMILSDLKCFSLHYKPYCVTWYIGITAIYTQTHNDMKHLWKNNMAYNADQYFQPTQNPYFSLCKCVHV